MLQLLFFTLFVRTSTSAGSSNPRTVQLTNPVDHAEGPVWDYRTNTLYYVDIHAGGLYAYHARKPSDRLRHINLDGDLSVTVPTLSSKTHFIVGLNRSLVLVRWDGQKNNSGNARTLTTVSPEFPRSRFNDGKADTRGRLWFGTMGYESPTGDLEPNEGSLFKFISSNLDKPNVMIHPVNISNGLAWNGANNKFYYIDTPTNQVREYDYDDVTGTISNPRVVFDVLDYPQLTGHPDGMTIDTEDNLWIALYNGGAVVKVNPRIKSLLEILPLPAQYVTSVTWGGINYATLFVTTSRFSLNEEERKQQPSAGSVFAILKTGACGRAPNFADIVNISNKDA